MSKLHYFAYGSNMLHSRLTQRNRAPSATLVTRARLPKHQLYFDKLGIDGSGKCDVRESPGHEVWGGVYLLEPADRQPLDRAESLGVGYRAVDCDVRLADGRTMTVFLYQALLTQPDLRPFDWYLDLVVAGAQELGLPPDYIQSLTTTRSDDDPDPDRASRERKALPSQAVTTQVLSCRDTADCVIPKSARITENDLSR